MKLVMDIFGEKPNKKWMKLLSYLLIKPSKRNKIIEQRRKDNKLIFNLRVRKTHRGYVLGEWFWESKKTLTDYLSYLNQYSFKDNKITVNVYNDRPFGNCDFILDMIGYKRSFKRLNFASIMLRDDDNEWWSITNQLD